MTTVGEAIDAEAGHAHWLRVAQEIADDLATDAVDREQAGKAPFDEVARLREAGLLTLPTLAGPGAGDAGGTGGADWRTAYAVVRTISAADGAIGYLLGCHYFLSSSARFFASPALATRVEQESAARQWCWGGGLVSCEPSPGLTPTARGYVLNGRQSCVTGVGIADRLVVRATRSGSGDPLAVLVDPAHPGVVYVDDEDTFGQRLAAGGSVEFDSVPVTADDVFGSLSSDEGALPPFAGLAAPTARLVSVQFCLGVAEGLLAEVREYSRVVNSSWQPSAQHSWPGSPSRDPYVLGVYGELTVAARSASALADQAVEALGRGFARGEDLDDDECAEIAVLASVAESAASRAAQEITTRALDVIGARAAFLRHGFDRFWRNARTHTLREPVADRLREVGDYFLNGAHPPFTIPS
ncbi:type 2 domain-containing Acyl-CoA dehydrogenase [Streptomyces bingchenggensis BCW-1]|uniref:Type 2 domain-containing Acyl-CoA dehydrogenase n=1 Tax=Streptomyces bingchenggensis (strain BCW-1) TaxID=749414 RepID=D7C7Q2_STRBB|nr:MULTISPECIES: acyl-CoA dehydrogenase family protein [Streptomyces]ADI12600.1 type 2 domain-containing Acyl-CoA dehydrogenase [Streptomyces bingchenggensis BCW-1]